MSHSESVPDLLLEQLVLGELTPEQEAEVRARLGADADAQIKARELDNRVLLERNPPDQIANEIRRRLRTLDPKPEPADSRWLLWLGGGVLVAAAAALAIWANLGGEAASSTPSQEHERIAVVDPPPDTVRLKGSAAIVLRRQVGSGSELLAPGDAVRSGDTILVSYRSGGQAHGVLVSLDGGGETTLHQPERASDPTALRDGGVVTLHSFELDDAPEFEHFFFVTAPKPIDVAEVLEVLASPDAEPSRAAERLRKAGPGWDVTDFPLPRQP